ncbi:hypothetical protein [Acinetobacter pullicarnis]|uniref:hypothetical protein n=1 Tax=Acinetobacter pullicarnis TaxID=2576829 RepID=UPI001C069909|nr:hypothetical protein [Acinetobacter pullicarnis]
MGWIMGGNRVFLNSDDGKKILETPKYFESPIIVSRDINKFSLYQFSGAPVYETSTDLNIVGLSIFLRTNIAPDSMKHSFGLVQNIGKNKKWIYDLCIYPEHQRSHVDRKKREVFYGPHVHCLDDSFEINLDYSVDEWDRWFGLFAKNINLQIRSDDIMGPLAGELLL